MAVSDAAVTRWGVHGWYQTLAQPPGAPPAAVFGPVWTALYAMMAVAAWRVWRLVGGGPALRLWGWQLLVNAAWTPVFFGLRQPAAGLVVLLLLFGLLWRTLRAFRLLDRTAGLLLAPYLAWVGYAGYLNAGTVILNLSRAIRFG